MIQACTARCMRANQDKCSYQRMPVSIQHEPGWIEKYHPGRITSGIRSIRTKAVSRTDLSCPVFVTPRYDQSSVEDQDLRAFRCNHLTGSKSLHHSSMRSKQLDHDCSLRTSSRRIGAEVGNGLIVFQGASRRLLHGSVWMRGRSINFPV